MDNSSLPNSKKTAVTRLRSALRRLMFVVIGIVTLLVVAGLIGGRPVVAVLLTPIAVAWEVGTSFPLCLPLVAVGFSVPAIVLSLSAVYARITVDSRGSLPEAVETALNKPAAKEDLHRWLLLGLAGALLGLPIRTEEEYPFPCSCGGTWRLPRADGIHVHFGWPFGWWPGGIFDVVDLLQAPLAFAADVFLLAVLMAVASLVFKLVISRVRLRK